MSVPAEERAHGRISMKTYYHYFKAGGGYVFTFIVLVIFILCEVSLILSQILSYKFIILGKYNNDRLVDS